MSNSADNNDVVILAAARTPQGRLNGQLASFTAVELGAHAIRAALAASGVKADQVDAVIMGQVLQAGAGQNPARQSAIGAGIGWNVPTVTINKVCLSGPHRRDRRRPDDPQRRRHGRRRRRPGVHDPRPAHPARFPAGLDLRHRPGARRRRP